MKKFLFGVCVIVLLVLAGCVSSAPAYVFDPGIPENQMSYLWVPNYVNVKQFNGRTVDWIAPPLSMTPINVGVPSGEHTFIIDTVIIGDNRTGVPIVKDQSFTHYFQAGRGYQLIDRNGVIVLIDLQ